MSGAGVKTLAASFNLLLLKQSLIIYNDSTNVHHASLLIKSRMIYNSCPLFLMKTSTLCSYTYILMVAESELHTKLALS